jgi:16S rRNA (uracil1498-N3)-methyltransferase
MRIPRIFTEQVLLPGAAIELDSGPAQHVGRVLRMGPGDPLTLFDGRGGEYPSRIVSVERRRVVAQTGEHVAIERESPLRIHLGIAVSRGDRMDWVVQKATELGVDEISPLFTERTEVKLTGERAEKKTRHWRQVATSACEQCGRNRLPAIRPPQQLSPWLSAAEEEARFVLHHRAGPQGVSGATPTGAALLIGPEGGLDEPEIEAAQAAGFQALALGPRVLRTETAPLAAIALLQARWGDMKPPA